jgi:zinc finger HIT domain-containing protein 1
MPPLIEVLPNSTSINAPGWAYVPETAAPDPSRTKNVQTGSRYRAARNLGQAGSKTGERQDAATTRQNNAIAKRIQELDRDNHKDVQIPIPVRQRDGAGRGVYSYLIFSTLKPR